MSKRIVPETPSVDRLVAVVKESTAPLTAVEIGKAALRLKSLSAKQAAQIAAILSDLPASAGVQEWPKRGPSRLFCARPLRASVEEAFLNALASQPLTPAKAVPLVRKALGRVAVEKILKEIKAVAPALISAKRISMIAVNRQSFIYLSPQWLEGQRPASAPPPALGNAVLDAIEHLQSDRGNYVRVDRLRATPAIRQILDHAVLELADAGKLVLARYDGPRPVPEEQKVNFVEDAHSVLFIGVALPRQEEVSA